MLRKRRDCSEDGVDRPTLTAEFGQENVVLTPRRIAEIHVYGGNIIHVATGDVLSFALVYPDSFQLSPHV